MAVLSLSSVPGISSVSNVGSIGNGTSAVLTQKLTGSSSLVGITGIGTPTAVPASASTAAAMTTPGGATLLNQETLPLFNQLGTTPTTSFNNTLNPLAPDAYRYGSSNSDTDTGDSLVVPRTLGEFDDEVATIGLYTQGAVQNSLNNNTPGFTPVQAATSLSNADGDVITGYSRFFLQSVQESQQEKFQIVETFTSYYAFFFGKRPPIYSFRGSLINDPNHKWTNDLMFFYENFFRGTQSVQLGTQAVINYDGRLVYGFILNLNIQEDSIINKGAQFSFDVLIMNHVPLYQSGDLDDIIAAAQQLLAAQAARIQSQIKSVKLNPSSTSAYRVSTGLQNPNTTSTATSPNSALQTVTQTIQQANLPKAALSASQYVPSR